MQSSMIKSITEDFGNGGTIDGDLTISGDLQVSGGGSLSFDEIVQGTSTIKVTDTSAFLVEKADGTDVFVVDTTNSRVGIGTSSPATTLHVADDGSSNGIMSNQIVRITPSDANNGINIGSDGTDGMIGVTNNDTDLHFLSRTGGTYSKTMTIDSSSNVGIGTTSPEEKIHSTGAIVSTGVNDTGATAGTERAFIDLVSNKARIGHFRGTTSAGSGGLQLYTDSVERMSIDASGNVGIGTDSASGKIHVKETAGDEFFTFANGNGIGLVNNVASHGIGISASQSGSYGGQGSSALIVTEGGGSANAGTIQLVHDGTIGFTYKGGKVGIGTSTPQSSLEIELGGDTGTYFEAGGNGASSSQSDARHLKMTASTTTNAGDTHAIDCESSTGVLKLQTSGTDRMVIDANSRISLSNNDSGTSNTVFGKLAGDALASGGNYNVILGENAGNDLTTGDRNILIGYLAGDNITTQTGNILIGKNTGGTGQQLSILIGNDTGRLISSGNGTIGLGHNTLYMLQTGQYNTVVGYDSMRAEVNGDRSTAFGYQTLRSQTGTDGTVGTTAIGYKAGYNATSGIHGIFIGADANPSSGSSNNEIVIGYGVTGVGSNTAIIGNSSTTDVYMGDNGNAWSQTSDGRLKENVVNWNKGLSEIEKLRIVEFNFKKDNPFNYDSKKKRQGIIAQEVKEIIPEMIKDDGEWLSANTEPMVWTLVKAVQELSARVKELESK